MTTLARQDSSAAVLFVGAGVALGILAMVRWWLPPLLIGGAVVAALAIRRPVALLPLLFAAIYLEGLGGIDRGTLTIPITLSKLAAAGAAVAWIVHAGWTRRRLVRWATPSAGLVALVLAMLLSMAASRDLSLGAPFPLLFGVVTLAVLTHLIGAMIAPGDLRLVLRGTAVMFVGLLAATAGRAGRVDLLEERLAGTLGDPNEWSTAVLVAAPLLAAALVRDRWRWSTPLLVALLALFPFHVLLSLSRAGMITLALIAPALLWVLRPRSRLLLAGLALAVALVPLFASPEALVERFQTLTDADAREVDGSMNTRSALVRVGLVLLRENWLTGVGAGMFPFEALGANSGATGLYVAHNTYLSIAVEQGLLGMVAIATLGGLLVTQVVRAFRSAATPELRDIAAGYAIGLIAFALMAATLNLVTFAAFYFVLGLGFAIERASEQPQAALTEAGLG